MSSFVGAKWGSNQWIGRTMCKLKSVVGGKPDRFYVMHDLSLEALYNGGGQCVPSDSHSSMDLAVSGYSCMSVYWLHMVACLNMM